MNGLRAGMSAAPLMAAARVAAGVTSLTCQIRTLTANEVVMAKSVVGYALSASSSALAS
jgi:hypothetical protein